MADRSVETREFRRTLGHFCTGVVIVTSASDDGVPAGLTVQSLVSLSLTPPLVGFSPSKTSKSWKKIAATRRFCANILAADQADLCKAFATSGADKFTGVEWRPCVSTGLPVIDGSLAYISCFIEVGHETGDHYFVVGRVREMKLLRPYAEPLLAYKGALHSLFPERQKNLLFDSWCRGIPPKLWLEHFADAG